MPTATAIISRGELRLMALAAVNDELDRLVHAIADGARAHLSGIAYHDRIRLKEGELENGLLLRGIRVTSDDADEPGPPPSA